MTINLCVQNYRRVAEVWMDEYAEYLYQHRPHYRNIDAGDLTEQLAIRTKLNCKPFKWFMENVAFDLVKYYPPVEPSPLAEGEVWMSLYTLKQRHNKLIIVITLHVFICLIIMRIDLPSILLPPI